MLIDPPTNENSNVCLSSGTLDNSIKAGDTWMIVFIVFLLAYHALTLVGMVQ